jgi:arylsulfatase A
MRTSIQTLNGSERIFHHADFATSACRTGTSAIILRIIHHAPRIRPQLVNYSSGSAPATKCAKHYSTSLSVAKSIRATPEFITTGLLCLVNNSVRRCLSLATCLFACLLLSFLGSVVAQESKPPNIVLILADDLGWTDLACYGSDLHETPHLDRLAASGMKFTQAYSACTVCSPTRASILTGKYPARLHVTDWIPGLAPANPKLLVPDWTKQLPLEEQSLAEVLRSAGYATATIGKWHLGNEDFYPEKHGFDLNIAGTSLAATRSFFAPYNIATLPDGPPGEYLTDRLASEAAAFIRDHKDKPFFLYCPHYAVHLPIHAQPELIEKYRGKLRPGLKHTNPTYAAMLESLDQAVGRILQTLDEQKLADNTVVIFTSDNGGHLPTTSNAPLRYGKASCYEGGTRVPLIVRWPRLTQPGSVCEVPVISPDLYPTVLSMAQVPGTPKQDVDGVSLAPLLRQTGTITREALFWHYPHYQLYQQGGTTPYGAVRAGDWKYIEFFDGQPAELYNLSADRSEQQNLASRLPDKAQQLANRLRNWQQEVGAQLPLPNPAYNPAQPQHIPAKKAKAK